MIILIVKKGDVEFVSVVVRNNLIALLPDVKIAIQGIPSSRYSVEPSSTALFLGTNQTYVIKYIIPYESTIRDIPIIYKAYSGTISDEKSAILSIVEEEFRDVRIKDVKTKAVTAGGKGFINITLENRIQRPVDVNLTLQFPKIIDYDKNYEYTTLSAGEVRSINFGYVTNAPGLFKVDAILEYEELRRVKGILIVVLPFNWLILFAVLVIILIIFLLWWRRRAKEQKYRRFRSTYLRSYMKR